MQAAEHLNNRPVITAVRNVEEARSLPAGSLVGDFHGGVTFTDAVAHILEQRSSFGWCDVKDHGKSGWTVIYLNR